MTRNHGLTSCSYTLELHNQDAISSDHSRELRYLPAESQRRLCRGLKRDKTAADLSARGPADEPSLFLRPVVIAPDARTAAIRGENGLAGMAFCETVEMPAEDRLQIQAGETLQDRVGIQRPRDDSFA